MSSWASVDPSTVPPQVTVPRRYNAAVDFIDRHLGAGIADRTAVIDDRGGYTYRDLAQRVNRAGNALRALGVGMESRVAMCMLDAVDFPAVFWGAIKIGAVPVPLNTLLTPQDYDYMLRDSRAHTLVVSGALYDVLAPVLARQPHLRNVVIAGEEGSGLRLASLMGEAPEALEAADTTADDVAFWLYTSGSTGSPKGSMHLQSDLVHTAALYGLGVLGIEAGDVVFSAAKLFFAYGLGNGMTFPLHAGATAVLMAERPTPAAVMRVLATHRPTVFYGVPTLYGAILADPANQRDAGSPRLRRCVSAGEALPEGVAVAWEERFGVPILDGLGSTEMLHIFLSNRPGDVRYGTSGKPVPGYAVKVVDDEGAAVAPGELGELWVSGPSSAVAYWNQRTKSLAAFQGPWTRTGDKYRQDADGYYVYCGRTDDMLKVSGNWVSPFEVESALIEHEEVMEAAVVGHPDESRLIKPKAFVVLKNSARASDALAEELKQFVKGRLAPYKYPRWVEFRDALPKTATGKIKRFMLRE
jgi:benzoate-CoA ligase family protein